MLGTVQLGTDYGIGNRTGIPTRKEAFDILSMAWEFGIRNYDTAPAYGSEAILGDFIRTNGLEDLIRVSTKIPPLPKLVGKTNFREHIDRSLEGSLSRLGAKIDVLYFHVWNDSLVILEDLSYFQGLVHESNIARLGLSIYETSQVTDLDGFDLPLAYQFPFNVLDTRFSQVRFPNGRRYARSVFLQGLLTTNEDLKPNALKELVTFHNKYSAVLNQFDVNPVEFALSFVRSSGIADFYLIGVENVGQLTEILRSNMLSKSTLSKVVEKLPKLCSRYCDPRYWRN